MRIYYRSIQAAAPRLPDHPRLPLALGHRLVLVLARAGCRSRGCARCAQAAAAQRRVLEGRRLRAAARLEGRRSTAGAARPSGSRWSRTSRCPSTGCPSSSTSSTARSASRRSGSARCGSATPTRRGTSTSSTRRRTYVNVGFWSTVPLPEGSRDGRPQPADRAGGRRPRRPQVAVLDVVLRGTSSGRPTAERRTTC